MKKAVLVAGARTPFLKAGTMPGANAGQLGEIVTQALIQKYTYLPRLIDYVIGANVGNQILHPDGSNIGRLFAMRLGECGLGIGAWTPNVNCATGLHALMDAVKHVELGLARCVLVVASEVMSDYSAVYSRDQRSSFFALGAASRAKINFASKAVARAKAMAKIRFMPHQPLWLVDLGLTDPTCGLRMDETAELLAKEFGISREEQDLFALRSQRKAALAQRQGRFAKEIVPAGKFEHDNGIRQDQSLKQLARLAPRYPGGTVTAGNSSQLTDGACALLVAEEEFAKALDWPNLAHLTSHRWALVGCEPQRMGIGPVLAIKRLLDKTGMILSDFGVIESNEAFAAVVLAQMKALASKRYCSNVGLARPLGELAFDITNVNGGAVAMGHPIAASGARLALTCAIEMGLRGKELGLVTLCVGGGQGEAVILERKE